MTILKTEILKPLNKKKPKQIIILFHGYGGNGKSISLLANFWRRKLLDTVFYCPYAPSKCDNEKNKFKWFSPGEQNSNTSKSEIILSVKKIDKFIDQVLKENKLNEKNLVLGGFSQGCMLALEAGLQRKNKLKAIIGYSGMIIDIKKISKKIKSKPKIFLFHGDKDKVVLPKFYNQTKNFLLKKNFPIRSKLFKNCDHRIPALGANLGLDFLSNEMLL